VRCQGDGYQGVVSARWLLSGHYGAAHTGTATLKPR
jgi:hypothetical protein